MLMTAIKEHGYAGRRVKVGQEYEVRHKDVVILQTAGLAKLAKKVEKIPRNTEFEQKFGPPKPWPEPPLRNINYETRDEVAEESVSPEEGKKKKRRYKRKDMVPEQ